MRTEQVIISGLLKRERFRIKVLPYIKAEYFSDRLEKVIFISVSEYIKKYGIPPTIHDIKLDIHNNSKIIVDDDTDRITELLNDIDTIESSSDEWLEKTTEEFCQDKSLFNAIKTSIDIVDDPRKNRNSILSVLKDALSVSFNKDLGHDYVDDYEERFRIYAQKTRNRIPFDIELLNTITNGGIPAETGTLNTVMAGTNVGKTLFLVHHAGYCMSMGYKVAYFSMEMDETELSKRIDASILNIDINELDDTPEGFLNDRFKNVALDKIKGKLKFKRYPTGRGSVADFDAYLNELKIQENFVPDIVFVDYIGITASSILPQTAKQNSYLYFKSVSEELRAFGCEHNVPVMTAVQSNRGGFADSDPDMDKGSDSFGIFMTSDFVITMLTNDELENLSQYLIKQLKSRYNQKMKNKRFMVGYDLTRMRLFDVTASAQTSGLPPTQQNNNDPGDSGVKLKPRRSNTLDFGKIKV